MMPIMQRQGQRQESISTRQDKYHKGFYNDLDISQDLVDKLAAYLKRYGFGVRPQDDKTAFQTTDGIIRLADILAIYNNNLYGIEAKDFCQSTFYDVTGLSKRYVNDILMRFNNGKNSFIVFRENMVSVTKRASVHHVSVEEELETFIKNDFVIRRNDKIVFVPYGNRLSILMKPENMRVDLESRIKSHFGNYKNEDQYLWKMSAMLRFDKLISKEFPKSK